MNNLVQTNAIEAALMQGDLSKLTSDQRLSYYKQVCESLGLNALTKPFEYINLNNKLTLYAKRDATDQLRKVHKVSITISAREQLGELYVVTAKAKDATGREDESTGAVCVTGLKGETLANAFLKAETKAKRRVTLSLCGLGLLDESEVADIKDATPLAESPPSPVDELFELDGPPDLGEYVINIGQKHKGKKFKDMDLFQIDGYQKYFVDAATKNDKPLTGDFAEFVQKANEYLRQNEFVRK